MNAQLPKLATIFVLLALILSTSCGGDNSNEKAVEDETLRDSLVLTMVATDSITVFDLLDANHAVEFKNSAMGVFVTTIDSMENSPKAYWVYSVNGKMIPMACDRHTIGVGDTLVWHLRRPRGE